MEHVVETWGELGDFDRWLVMGNREWGKQLPGKKDRLGELSLSLRLITAWDP